jgi:hypothetical protein
MTSQTARVLPFLPPRDELQQRVRDAAANTDVLISVGTLAQLIQRGLSDIKIVRLLQNGIVTGAEPGTTDGGWLCDVSDADLRRQQLDVSSVTVEICAGELWVLKIKWVIL